MHYYIGKVWTWILDVMSGGTLLFGLAIGQSILAVLGGIASLLAIANHLDAMIQRRKEKKKNKQAK